MGKKPEPPLRSLFRPPPPFPYHHQHPPRQSPNKNLDNWASQAGSLRELPEREERKKFIKRRHTISAQPSTVAKYNYHAGITLPTQARKTKQGCGEKKWDIIPQGSLFIIMAVVCNFVPVPRRYLCRNNNPLVVRCAFIFCGHLSD